MEMENEKTQDQLHEEPKTSREGYQKEFRPVGRSPRPRIHTNTRPANNAYERPAYGRRPFYGGDDEGAFRPEGFGSSLQNTQQQRP